MASNKSTNAIDETKLQEFMVKAAEDMSGSIGAMMIMLGERLGLYKAMADSKHITSDQLATKTNTAERYVREWLASQAAAGYVKYNPSDQTFSMPSEQALVLADDESPFYIQGAYQIIRSIFKDEEKFLEIFKTGKGLRWGEHDHNLFEGTAKFFKPNYLGNLVQSWIPSLDGGVEHKLKQGAKVVDIGCGYGISTIIMAKEYPNSKFYGFDNHKPSIESAQKLASKEGVTNRVEFRLVSANEDIGKDYDLITFFDCLHDMGDPVAVLKFARRSLKPDGTCMIVEPMANNKLEDNINLMGKISYSVSAIVCVPNSLADNGPALGAQAGEERTRKVAEEAGFGKFTKTTQTPFNMVYEAKP